MNILRKNFKSKLAIFVGSLSWTLIMFKSGWIYSYGMGFWGPNGHDGVWHVSLASSLARGSWMMPIFAGENIKNYHIGFDVLLALFNLITRIPIVNIYFQILPIVLSVAIGICVYVFVKEWKKSELAAFWAVVFTYFATSFGWLISVIRYRDIGGESMFWAQQAISTLINPPFALSLVFLFLGLICLQKDKRMLAVVFFGLLAQVKIYAAILVFSGLLVAGVFEWFKSKNTRFFQVLLLSALLSAAIFLPLNRSSSKVIIFKPFWFLETMMAVSDRANWPRYYEAMINYRAAHNVVKGVPAYLIAFAIFVIGNMGLRVLGLVGVLKSLKRLESIDVFMLILVMGGLLLPMVILQVGTPWNTIQFTYYSLVFSGLFAAITFASFRKQNLALAVFIVFTLPGVWGTLRQYLPARPPAMIVSKEVEALKFLATQSPGIVLTPVFDPEAARKAENKPPRSLYLYESTAYVSAFSNHPVFVEDQVNLNITDYPWQTRVEDTRSFFSTLDADSARKFLSDNNIEYIYLPQIYKIRPMLGQSVLGVESIFDNYEVAIWKVQKMPSYR